MALRRPLTSGCSSVFRFQGGRHGSVRGIVPETKKPEPLIAQGLLAFFGTFRNGKWRDSTPHQTTIESTQSKRRVLLRTSENSIEKPAGLQTCNQVFKSCWSAGAGMKLVCDRTWVQFAGPEPNPRPHGGSDGGFGGCVIFGRGIGKPPNGQGAALFNQSVDLLNHWIASKAVSGV